MSSKAASTNGGAVDLSEGAVRKVARLSRLALDNGAIQRSGEQLRAVLGYIDRLRELDLDGVEPMAHPLDVSNRLDPDEPRQPLAREALLRMAPEKAGPFVKVPKVLGEEGGA